MGYDYLFICKCLNLYSSGWHKLDPWFHDNMGYTEWCDIYYRRVKDNEDDGFWKEIRR